MTESPAFCHCVPLVFLCALVKELPLQQRATCLPRGQRVRSSAARKPLLTITRFQHTVPLRCWHPAEHLGMGTARLHPEQSPVPPCGGCPRCWHQGGRAHLRAQNRIAALIVLLVKQSEKRSRCCAKISNDVNYCSVHFFSLKGLRLLNNLSQLHRRALRFE